MSIFEKALHIPAERRLFEPQRAAYERVILPLSARPAPRFYGAVALAAFAAFACLCTGTEMLVSRGADGGALVFGFGFLGAAVLPAAIACVGLRDGLLRPPFLVIGADGVRDLRLGADPIAWTDVAEAELIAAGNGVNAIRLTLARDGAPRFNPCRIGGWSADWAKRRRSRTIALMLLDVRAHTLAHTILVLAARNGVAVEQAPPWQMQPLG